MATSLTSLAEATSRSQTPRPDQQSTPLVVEVCHSWFNRLRKVLVRSPMDEMLAQKAESPVLGKLLSGASR